MTDKISNELKTPLNILNTNTAQDFNASIDTKSTQDKKVEVAKTARWPYEQPQIDALNRIISDIEKALESKNTPALQEIASGEKLYTITKAEFNIGDFGGNNTRKIKLATLTASLEGENQKNPRDLGVAKANALLVKIDDLRKAALKALSTSNSSTIKETNTPAEVTAAQTNINTLLGLDDAELTKYVKNTTKLDNTDLSVIIYAAKIAGVDVTAIKTRVADLKKEVREEGVRTVLEQVLKATAANKNDIDNMEVKIPAETGDARMSLKEFVAKTQADPTLKTSAPFVALQVKIDAIKRADEKSKQVEFNSTLNFRGLAPFHKEYNYKDNIPTILLNSNKMKIGTQNSKEKYFSTQEASWVLSVSGEARKKFSDVLKGSISGSAHYFDHVSQKITEGTPTNTIDATDTTPARTEAADKYTHFTSNSIKGTAFGLSASLSIGDSGKGDACKIGLYVESMNRKEFTIDKNTGKPELRRDGTENFNEAYRPSVGAIVDYSRGMFRQNMNGNGEYLLHGFVRAQFDYTTAKTTKYDVLTDKKKVTLNTNETFVRIHGVLTARGRTVNEADFKNGKRSPYSLYLMTSVQYNMGKGNISNNIDKDDPYAGNYALSKHPRWTAGFGGTYDNQHKLSDGTYVNNWSATVGYNRHILNNPLGAGYPFGNNYLGGGWFANLAIKLYSPPPPKAP